MFILCIIFIIVFTVFLFTHLDENINLKSCLQVSSIFTFRFIRLHLNWLYTFLKFPSYYGYNDYKIKVYLVSVFFLHDPKWTVHLLNL